MTDEVNEIMNIFNITEEQALMMIHNGFSVSNAQLAVDAYITSQIQPVIEKSKDKVQSIIEKELMSD